jgi:hypothetical protein
MAARKKSSWPEAARLRELALALQGFLRSRKSGMRCAMSSSTCARSTAKAIPENGSWRGRFWSGSSGARWDVKPEEERNRGNSARISGAAGWLCHHGFAGDGADGAADAPDSQLDWALRARRARLYVSSTWATRFWRRRGRGYVTAWAAAANPLIHMLALGIVVLALAALSALQSKGKQPIWYQLALVAITPLGVLAGGLLRLRVLGIL